MIFALFLTTLLAGTVADFEDINLDADNTCPDVSHVKKSTVAVTSVSWAPGRYRIDGLADGRAFHCLIDLPPPTKDTWVSCGSGFEARWVPPGSSAEPGHLKLEFSSKPALITLSVRRKDVLLAAALFHPEYKVDWPFGDYCPPQTHTRLFLEIPPLRLDMSSVKADLANFERLCEGADGWNLNKLFGQILETSQPALEMRKTAFSLGLPSCRIECITADEQHAMVPGLRPGDRVQVRGRIVGEKRSRSPELPSWLTLSPCQIRAVTRPGAVRE